MMKQLEQEHLDSIAKSIHGILWEADATTFRFIYVSPQSKNILGYDPKEWYEDENFWRDHIHPDDRNQAAYYCHEQTKLGQAHEFEYRMICSDGSIVWLKDMVSVISEDGKPSKLRGLMVDITDHKEAEIEQQRLLNESYRLAKIGHWNYDLINDSLFWSQEVKNLHEVPADYKPNFDTAIQFYREGHDRQRIKTAIAKAIEKGEPYDLELQIVTKKGNVRWVHTVGKPELVNGKAIRIYGSTQDITERKQEKDQLEMLSMVASETRNIVVITDPAQHIEWVNTAFEEKTGYKLEEVIGRRPKDFLRGPETDKQTVERTNEHLKEHKPFTESILNYTKDGEKYWVKMDVTPIFDDDGNLKRYFAIQEDITERKKAFELIKRQKEILEDTQRIGKIGSWDLDLETKSINLSKEAFAIYERNPEDGNPTFDEVLTYYQMENREEFLDSFRVAAYKNETFNDDFQIITEKGNQIYVNVFSIPQTNDDGKVYAVHGTIQDITKRKTAEINLKKRKNQIKSLTNNLDGTIFRYLRKPNGEEKLLYINSGIEDLHEVKREEVLDNTELLWEQILEEDIPKLEQAINDSAKHLEKMNQKYRIKTPSGQLKWVQGRATPHRLDDGSVVWDALALDITEREHAKRDREEFQDLLQNSVSEIYIIDVDSYEILFANEVACRNFGYSEWELIGKTPSELNPEFINISKLDELRAKLFDAGDRGVEFESIHQRADGSRYPVQVNMKKGSYKGEEIFIAAAIDISVQKTIEKQLKEQVAISESIIDSMPGLFYMMDENLNLVKINKNASMFFDLDGTDLSKMDPLSLISPRERDMVEEKIRSIFETGYAEAETIMVSRGNEYNFYINGKLIEQDGQKHIIGNGLNITDRVKMRKNNEVLIKEVHHRVKNNLAIISGLLSLEMDEVRDKHAILPMQRSINRIQSMAKVHELLYDNQNFSTVNIEEYLKELVDIIEATFSNERKVNVKLDVDIIDLNVNEAIPLGMLFNELLTNSYKYAFDEDGGNVSITVRKPNGRYEAIYEDDGKGLKEKVDLEQAETLGMAIINTLLQQLDADYELITDHKFKLRFNFGPKLKGSHSNLSNNFGCDSNGEPISNGKNRSNGQAAFK